MLRQRLLRLCGLLLVILTAGSVTVSGRLGAGLARSAQETPLVGPLVVTNRLDDAGFLIVDMETGQERELVFGPGRHLFGGFSPHLNLGLVTREGWNQTNSVVAVGGFDHILSDRATLVVELVGDIQTEDSPLVVPEPVVFQSPAPFRTVERTNVPDRSDHLLDIGFGLKFQAPGDTRIVTSALLPFLEGGARPSFMWTVGLDRSF
jgi:hypothetical protein